MKKILGIHSDICHLGGHTRLFVMMMDVFKSLGYQVHVVARTKKESVAKADISFTDQKTTKPVLIPSTIKVKCALAHHSLKQLRKYQPVKFLSPNDISMHDIPVAYWGNHFLTPFAPEVVEMINEYDLVFCDTEMYVRIESDLDIADKHIQFVHFPTVNLMPVYTREPRMIWANSTFTQSWIRIRWGYNNPNYTKVGKKYATVKIPRQLFNAEVVHPPIYVKDYRNSRGFHDRYYDVVMFARLGYDKFTVAAFLDRRFKLLTMGAASPLKIPGEKKSKHFFKPKGDLHATVTFKQILELLKRAKVYVHGKGFGNLRSGGQSLPEHFGITILEAMASGCPAIVPKAGGCWTDISEQGKYVLGFSSLEELEGHLNVLVSNEDEWRKWHNLALERVKSFDTEQIKTKVSKLLS